MTPPVVIPNRLSLNSWGWRLTGRGTPRPTPDPAALHHTGVTTLTVTRQNVTPVRPTAAPGTEVGANPEPPKEQEYRSPPASSQRSGSRTIVAELERR